MAEKRKTPRPGDEDPSVTLLTLAAPYLYVAAAIFLPLRLFDTSAMSWPVFVPFMFVAVPLVFVVILVAPIVGGGLHRILNCYVFKTDLYNNVPQPAFPKTSSWITNAFWGHLPAIRKAEPAQAHLEWADETGSSVYIYRGMFFQPRILIADPKAMMYVLSPQHCYDFPKPKETRKFLADLLGHGLVTVEGETHKKQRKITAPAFSVSAVRSFTPTFFSHAHRLVDALGSQIDQTKGASDEPFLMFQSPQSAKESRPQEPVIDVWSWMGRSTLDIIGEVGFGYHFNAVQEAISGDTGGLSSAVDRLMGGMTALQLVDFLRIYLQNRPGLDWIDKVVPPSQRRKAVAQLGEVFAKAGADIVNQKKEEIRQEMEAMGVDAEKGGPSKAAFDEDLEGKTGSAKGRDLLQATIRANWATDVKPTERLDDEELIGQMMSFLLAGHETTATQLGWTLWRLADRPDVVARLRTEVEANMGPDDGDTPASIDYETLINMPWLDAVSREMLRLHAPVTATTRLATADSVIPLGKPYPGRKPGTTIDHIVVKAGQEVQIPIQVINSSRDLWGPTAREFDPARWLPENMPTTAKESGLPLQLMTFITGARSCVGSRTAITEYKAILCCLVRAFDFERVPGFQVEGRQSIVTRAVVKGQEEVGVQMPLRIKRVKRAQV